MAASEPHASAPFKQYRLNTALLPALALPATVTFQPVAEFVLSTAKLLIVALVVWACPLSVMRGSAGVLGATSKPSAPAPGFSAIVTVCQGMLAEMVNVFSPVAPAVAWMKSWVWLPTTLPLPDVKTLARFVVDPGGVIVKEPPALAALKSRITIVLLTVVVMLAALSLVPLVLPAVVALTSIGALFSTPT